jgi:hypothetical protein
MNLSPSDLNAVAKHYRPWTFSVSREHLKVGPLAFSWYRWCDRRWRLEATWGCGRRVFVVPKLT